jgi:hypothetical protein
MFREEADGSWPTAIGQFSQAGWVGQVGLFGLGIWPRGDGRQPGAPESDKVTSGVAGRLMFHENHTILSDEIGS